MFENVGQKIKSLAIINCVLSIVVSLIIAVVLIIIGIDSDIRPLIAIGILLGIGGFFSSWISSFLLLGYGELILNSTKTNELLKLIIIDRNV